MINRSDFSRRTFLQSGFTTVAGLSIGFVHGRAFSASSAPSAWTGFPLLRGEALFDDSSRLNVATDFGRHVSRIPAVVVRPAGREDVRAVLLYARRIGKQIVTRGHGCSAYGQTQIENGIVLDLSSLGFTHLGGSKNNPWMDVGPGTSWRDVILLSTSRGLTPSVFPDTTLLSVGGLVSVGGWGESSGRMGAAVDYVDEIELVLLDGRIKICSRESNSELFDAALAGMGQIGVITRIRIRLARQPMSVSNRDYKYSNVNEFKEDLAQAFQQVQKRSEAVHVFGEMTKDPNNIWSCSITVSNWTYDSAQPPFWPADMRGAAQAPVTKPFFDYVDRNTAAYQRAIDDKSILEMPRPYMSSFVPEAAAGDAMDLLINDSDASLGTGKTLFFPADPRCFERPLFKMPKGATVYHVRIFRKPAIKGSADHLRMIDINREKMIPWILANGGAVYLPHSPLLQSGQRTVQYDASGSLSDYQEMKSLKRRFDPARLLNKSAGLF